MATTTYTQVGRPLTIKTALAPDALLVVGFSGREEISRLYSYNVDLVAPDHAEIPFDKLLGTNATVTIELPGRQMRHFSGIVRRFSQGVRDEVFTHYRMEIVPQFWMTTKSSQSRIFQAKSVPEIIQSVLAGLDVAYEFVGTFESREYCVQYRESDFNFVSRLMEEEGIYYFFKHTADAHKMVVANTPQSQPELSNGSTLVFDEMTGGKRGDDRVRFWEKVQELRSGKVTLWDRSFELPDKHLDAQKIILESVKSGKVEHKLKVGGNGKLELYDYPGGYAKRFDGVTKTGGDQPANLSKVFQDNNRTAGIRMQEEGAQSIVIHGSSDCRHLVPGHRFTLQRHANADGKYLLTSVEHSSAVSADYRSGDAGEFKYENAFTCIPADLPFRPLRTTPRPRVDGSQTATVVGPGGEEIFADKYGRVKVQFHWDRQGKNDIESSCWVRVATAWAGRNWGMVHIPRIGQEVVVDFLEGDPDRPIIVGSVYNADLMPPYTLPEHVTQSGIKTRSSPRGGPENFNELRFEDKKGAEQVFLHAEKDSRFETENDKSALVGHNEEAEVKNDRKRKVGQNESVTVDGKQDLKVGKTQNESVGESRTIKIGTDDVLDVGQKLTIKAGQQITIETGASKIVMKSDGTIEISGIQLTVKGATIKVEASGMLTSEASGIHVIKGSLVKIN